MTVPSLKICLFVFWCWANFFLTLEKFRLGSFVQEVRWIEGRRLRVSGLGTNFFGHILLGLTILHVLQELEFMLFASLRSDLSIRGYGRLISL